MSILTAEEVRRTYAVIFCARCMKRCEANIADTMEYDTEGELQFRVEIYCPDCNIRDTVTRKGGVITRTSDGPSVTPEEWLKSARYLAERATVWGGGNGQLVRQVNRGGEGSIQGKGLSRTEAREALDKFIARYPELQRWLDKQRDERNRAYYRARHERRHARKRKAPRETSTGD